MKPDLRWTAMFAGAIALFLGAELSGLRGPRRGRTFTEQTRWVEAHAPAPARWGLRVMILGLATWAGVHLAEGLK